MWPAAFLRGAWAISVVALMAFCLLSGCNDAPHDTDAGTGTRTSPIPEACLIGGEAPQSIPEAIARINALPRPLSVSCLVASLPRPLSLVATDSPFSAQPGEGVKNPRIFILSEGLVLSVVPTGRGSRVLEFAEWVTTTRTIKGEVPFPIEGTLPEDAPYDIRFDGGGTTCSLCHRNESPAEGRPGAFVSDAMRPANGYYAPIRDLFAELDECDWDREAERCEFLSALLDFGPVEEVTFSNEVDTFF
ncbi:MAG: hypothetical protein DRJ42_02235 [Deltaproteobacteria bacterium]|nr:MAG: hypothetical protein DRJ42_02235 [Deltaproteobacteria bacterium]